jgi:hypothetical protein
MRLRSIAAALSLILAAGEVRAEGAAPLDLARFASLDAIPFTGTSFGFSELEDGPAAVRDGDPRTAWQVPGSEGDTATLVFDFTGPNAVDPIPVASIRVVVTPADAAIGVQTGRDLASLADAPADVTRDAEATTLTLRGAPALRVLALRFPAGAAVTSVEIVGAPTNGTLGPVAATCDERGVHLALHARGVLGVLATRALPGGGAVRLEQRRARDAVLTDASVRFDPRPATYTYQITGYGSSDPPASVSVTCSGPALARPAPGPIHGVIEGFYGRPWTWHEREKVVLAMGALGMDTYIYAPKNDPLHRDQWRDPYDADTLARFADLHALGAGVGVDVVWAVSPGLDIDPAQQADVDALVAKVASLATGAGIRDAALLMDDIGAAHTAAVGAAHAGLAAKLLASMKERDPASRLWFVPTVYAGLAGNLQQADLDYLAGIVAMPAEVPVAWTGAGTFASSIDLPDAAAFGALFGRGAEGVWIWDNYPVNDVAVFRRLYTRPITGRESLYPASGGVLSNPMRHALASIPAVASYAEMALDPQGYATARAAGEPLQTADLALALADAEGPPRALADLFAELVHHDTLWSNDLFSPGLTAAVAAYQSAPAAGSARRAAALDLASRLARLAVADLDLRRDLDDQALADEIDAYARATSITARAVLASLGSARASLAGKAPEAASAASESACLWLTANQPSWRTIQDGAADLVAMGDTSACGDADPYAGVDPVRAPLGEPWSFAAPDPLRAAGATFSLIGPAGATISATGSIAWKPDRLGRFRLVALATSDEGTTAKVIDLIVTEPAAPPAIAAAGGCSCAVLGGDSERAPLAIRAGYAGPGFGAACGPIVMAALLALITRRRRTRRRRCSRCRDRRASGSCGS